MTLPRAAALVAAASLALSLSPLTSADAAGRHFGTVVTLNTAKFQLCKVPVDGGASFKLFGRLNNNASKPKEKVKGGIYVLRNEKRTNNHFETAYIAGGKTSKVDHLVVKKDPKLSLEVYAAATQAGNGDVIALSDVRHC